ncbi:uncharacterized protein N0V89_005921 [Didymosphaeria variabile]|uniref:Uncharacterized protein n=1 Tax=Didymosphaeria variabile TaxID=1932322 RepID=A0A9W9CC73_9PLEO|nr:uncharacterized protein N0V89_005921 [Didymosphaeria variabile]KAJ4354188.1 hypothetical protein N0V89_005921 [Didymosphaeria variabile]
MADAMRAALQLSSPPPESTCERDMRASYNAINALLDREVAAEGHPIDDFPQLLRLFTGRHNVGGFAAMVEFAGSPRQRLVNWRNCAAHKERLAAIDLSDSEGALKRMETEAHGQAVNDSPPQARNSGSAETGSQLPGQMAGATLLHPSFANNKPSTLLSPYSTPVQKPVKPAETPPIHAEHAPADNIVKPPTPSPSPFRSGSAQEHLQQSRTHLMEGHMPRLNAGTYHTHHNRATNGSPYVNGNITAHSCRPAGGQDSRSAYINGHENAYSSTTAPISHHGATPQQQTPYGNLEDPRDYGRDQLVPSHSGQTVHSPGRQYQYNGFNPPHYRSTFGTGPPSMAPISSGHQSVPQNSRSAYVAGSQAHFQQRDGRSVMDPYAEFKAEVNRQQPPRLQMPMNLSSPLSRQQHATPPSNRAGAHVQQHGQSRLSYPRFSNTEAGFGDFHTAIPRPITPVCPKTKEELEYEQKLAAWREQQAENNKRERIKKERKKKLKDELDAEMRLGNDVLNYRYRDYVEVYPLSRTERMSPYHLNLLANQVIQENDRSEEAMAVRYAKKNFENLWTVKDKPLVIKEMQDKAKVRTHGLFEEMKIGGHLMTAQDIEAIRQSVPSYAKPEVVPEVAPEVVIEE